MPTGVEDIVAGIIADVRENGDKALLEYNRSSTRTIRMSLK